MMETDKNKKRGNQLWILFLALAIILIGIYFENEYLNSQKPVVAPPVVGSNPNHSGSGNNTPPPPVGNQNEPPPVTTEFKIGDSVKARVNTQGCITKWRGTGYYYGGSDGNGKIQAGYFAGIITELGNIADGANVVDSVRVDNFTYPMKSTSGGNSVNSFWLDKRDLVKS